MAKSKKVATKEKKTKNVTTSKRTEGYWDTVKEMLDIAGRYISAVKLRANVLDPATKHKVEPVFRKYYGGNMSHLVDAIESFANSFYAKVEKWKVFCLSEGIPFESDLGFPDPGVLFSLLVVNDRRDFYRNRMKKARNADLVVPLETIEIEYRGRK